MAMEDEVMSEVAAPPRRVLLVSAGASHSVALLSKHQLVFFLYIGLIVVVVDLLNGVLHWSFLKRVMDLCCNCFKFCDVS